MESAMLSSLYELARLHGVITAYRDYTGATRQASPQALLAVLGSLGVPVERPADIGDALRMRKQELWRRPCEPVAVCRPGNGNTIELRLKSRDYDTTLWCRLEPESGEALEWKVVPASLPIVKKETLEGVIYAACKLPLPGLPPGYHRLTLQVPGNRYETTIISAPLRAYEPAGEAGRAWGVFLPLYALRSGRSWAAGDVTDIEALLDWVHHLGGSFAGTLPLLASFLDDPFDPSPYAPVSRMFWNEFYLDVTRIPELGHCRPARELLNSPGFQAEIAALRDARLVNYSKGMNIKRKVLEMLSRCCYAGESGRLAELRRWAAENPVALDYARFRAAVSKQGTTWTKWPEPLKSGHLRQEDFDPGEERYHLYTQWVAHQQFSELAARAREKGPGLYLDFPLGVHSGGYDVWRQRHVFATGASCGAPPDRLHPGGQNWGFPPPHPERLREQAYRYYITCLRHHFKHAGILRLDHIMGLHRIFWIPAGLPASQGVYVRYPHEEFYAILTLESRRHRTLLVGEDLGTVPAQVRLAMNKHGIQRMYVLPFEMKEPRRLGLNRVPPASLACLNTHDMPTFIAFWRQSHRDSRHALCRFLYRRGLLAKRKAGVQAVLLACLKYLATSRARVVLINLEDLWLETAPQNIPGTGTEKPNWQRKASRDFESFSRAPVVLDMLGEINRIMQKGGLRCDR